MIDLKALVFSKALAPLFFLSRCADKNAQFSSQIWKGQALKAGFANDLRLHLACAMASGTVACLATQPVDCVKTRIINMQSTCVLVAG